MNSNRLKKNYLLLVASTIDGKIALNRSHFSDWTSNEDKIHLRETLNTSDVILVGHNTYKTAYAPLSKRLCVVLSNQDFNKAKQQESMHLEGLFQANENCIFCNPNIIDIREYFEASSWNTICILGGTKTYTLALEQRLISEIILTIEPVLFGKGLDIFSSAEKNIPAEYLHNIHLSSVMQLNSAGTLLLRYLVTHN